jgi:hypothetical protein
VKGEDSRHETPGPEAFGRIMLTRHEAANNAAFSGAGFLRTADSRATRGRRPLHDGVVDLHPVRVTRSI